MERYDATRWNKLSDENTLRLTQVVESDRAGWSDNADHYVSMIRPIYDQAKREAAHGDDSAIEALIPLGAALHVYEQKIDTYAQQTVDDLNVFLASNTVHIASHEKLLGVLTHLQKIGRGVESDIIGIVGNVQVVFSKGFYRIIQE